MLSTSRWLNSSRISQFFRFIPTKLGTPEAWRKLHPSEAVALLTRASVNGQGLPRGALSAAAVAVGGYVDSLSPTECSSLLQSASALEMRLSAQSVAFLVERSSIPDSVFGPPVATNVYLAYISAVRISRASRYPFDVSIPPLILYPGSAEDVPLRVLTDLLEAIHVDPPHHVLSEIGRQCEVRGTFLSLDDVIRGLHVAVHFKKVPVVGCLVQVLHARHADLSTSDTIEVLTLLTDVNFPVIKSVLRSKLTRVDLGAIPSRILLSFASLCQCDVGIVDGVVVSVCTRVVHHLQSMPLDKDDLLFLLSASCSGRLAPHLQKGGQKYFDTLQLHLFNLYSDLNEEETLDALLCVGRWAADAHLLPAYPAVDELKASFLRGMSSFVKAGDSLELALKLLARFFNTLKHYFFISCQDRTMWEDVQRVLTRVVPETPTTEVKSALKDLSLELVDCGLLETPQLGM